MALDNFLQNTEFQNIGNEVLINKILLKLVKYFIEILSQIPPGTIWK